MEMKRIIAILLALLIVACSRAVDKSELFGVYAFEKEGLKQKIVIKMSGEYLNSFYAKGILSWSDTGKWEYDTVEREVGITFSNFRFGVNDTSTLRGYWFVIPEKTLLGGIELCFDLDLHLCFSRQNTMMP